ncbi:MAG: DnaD domain protein [Oscillospiraceae bacterium]|jgi:DnaD/phage-associated family protein|nr:DnaD domain protein [Oscillospiraceae bacterium]
MTFNFGKWQGVFAVPNKLADELLPQTDGSSLKVLLYLMRHGGTELSAADIAKATGLSAESVKTAEMFWRENGFLTELPPERNRTGLTHYDPGEISDSIEESPEEKALFVYAEKLFARPLRHSEKNTLHNLTQDFSLTTDILQMLLFYCKEQGRVTAKFILDTAAEWEQRGVDTVKKAEERITLSDELKLSEIRRMFKMQDISTEQEKLIFKWRKEWGVSLEALKEAYNTMLDGTGGKKNFKYLDKVLGTGREKTADSDEEYGDTYKQLREMWYGSG